MGGDERTRLEAAVEAAEAEIERLRAENAAVAEAFRAEPKDDAREILKRGAKSLAAARDRLDAAKAALAVFDKTGSPHGVLAVNGHVTGTIAVKVAPGSSKVEREAAIEAALADELAKVADELGVVLSTTPEHFTKELPGRDAEGRTVLEVGGRVEGDRLIPAVSRAAKNAR